ncbi:hypothetical protein EON63_17875 [archaeon]|nr:MAG: hypothetical protein EON63_17875 [archaeon]
MVSIFRAYNIHSYNSYTTIHHIPQITCLTPHRITPSVAAYDQDLKTPELYMVEPSGVGHRYFGCAAGKGANSAKTELEKVSMGMDMGMGIVTLFLP